MRKYVRIYSAGANGLAKNWEWQGQLRRMLFWNLLADAFVFTIAADPRPNGDIEFIETLPDGVAGLDVRTVTSN